MRVLFALPGLHRVQRGAEVAFESVAKRLAPRSDTEVTVIGSGPPRSEQPYRYLRASCAARERFRRWPRFPPMRSDCAYEEATFAAGLMRVYRPSEYDLTVACSYPFTNWALRAKRNGRGRPKHVFVTQNSDWPAIWPGSEYRWFFCDGLVCTNPEYYERNKDRWPSVLIPNGVDPDVFKPGAGDRARFGLPDDKPVALMVSALIPSKRVIEGIRAAAHASDLHLVVAGDGPLRDQVEQTGRELLGERFRHLVAPRDAMPDLYRSADVFLHMSQVEPSANAYIEALATGLPIVTHDRDVTRWTLEDQALLVDTDDESAVAGALERALTLGGEDATRARVNLARRRFSWETLAGQYAAFFRQVLGEPSPESAGASQAA